VFFGYVNAGDLRGNNIILKISHIIHPLYMINWGERPECDQEVAECCMVITSCMQKLVRDWHFCGCILFR